MNDRQLLVLTFGRVSQMLIMFFTYRLLSTVLSVQDMGGYYFLLSISALFGLIYANPLGMYANRMMHLWKSEGIFSRRIGLVLWSFGIGIFFMIPGFFIFKEKMHIPGVEIITIVGVLVFYIYATSFNGTVVPSLNLLGFTNQFVIWTLLTSAMGLLASYYTVTRIFPGPLGWLLGQAVALFICGSFSLYILNKKISTSSASTSGVNYREVLNFALPIAITNIAVWSLAQSFRFFYKENVDPVVLGELSFGLGLATALSVAVEYLLQQIYFPDFYKKISDPKEENSLIWNYLFSRLFSPYLFLMMFLVGLSPFLLTILANEKFKNASLFLALGAVVEFFRMLGNVFNMGTQTQMKTSKAIAPYLTGGAVTLIFIIYVSHNPSLIKWTPLGLMAGYLVAALLLLKNLRNLLVVNLNLRSYVSDFLLSLLFLTALLFKHYSANTMASILITFVYGLFMTWLLYRGYVKKK